MFSNLAKRHGRHERNAETEAAPRPLFPSLSLSLSPRCARRGAQVPTALYKVKMPAAFAKPSGGEPSAGIDGAAKQAARPDQSQRRRPSHLGEGSDASASSSPEPEENYSGMANGVGGDASARYASLTGAPFYDPHETGSFPPRPPQSWTDVPTMAVMPEPRGDGEAPGDGAVFGWVPSSLHETGHYVRPKTAELPVRTDTSMMLELFDNPELETRSPEQWLTRGPGDSPDAPGVGAVSRYYTQMGQFAWEACFVTGHDASDGTFTIEWKKTPGVAKRVKRLNLIFDTESAPQFRTRLASAMAMREQFESELRYHMLVENMPFLNPDILDEDFKQRIMYLSGWNLSHKLPYVVDEYMESARDDYRRSVKRAILDLSLRDPEEAKRIKEEAAVEALAQPIQVPTQGCVDPRAGGEGKLVVSHGDHRAPTMVAYSGEDFFVLQDEIGAVLPGADKGFLKAQQQFYRELDVRGLLLVNVDARSMAAELTQPMPLQSFDDFQRTHLRDAADMLRTELVVKVVNICQDLESEGVLEAESTTDKIAKQSELARRTMLPRFVKQLVLTIADQVRTVVLNSVESFAGFWTSFEGGDARAAMQGVTSAHCLPLIEVKLVVRNGDAAFEPPLEEVCAVMLAIFDDIVTSVQGIEDVGSKMASSGIGDDAAVETMPTPSADEPCIVEARAAVKAILEENFIGPRELARQFRQFAELMAPPEPEPEVVAEDGDAPEGGSGSGSGVEGEKKHEGGSGGGEALVAATHPRPSLPSATQASTVPSTSAATDGIEDEGDEDEDGVGSPKPPPGKTLAELETEIQRLATLAEAIESCGENFVNFRMLGVSCYSIKETLTDAALSLRATMLDELTASFNAANMSCFVRYQQISDQLNMTVSSAEELDEMKRFMEASTDELAALQSELGKCTEMSEAIQASGRELPDEVVSVYWDSITWPSTVASVLKDCDNRIHQWKFRFQDELRADQQTLLEDIDSISTVVDQFVEQGDINAVEERLAYVQEVESKLKALVTKSELYQSREELFGLALTEYPQLEAIAKAFEPYGGAVRAREGVRDERQQSLVAPNKESPPKSPPPCFRTCDPAPVTSLCQCDHERVLEAPVLQPLEIIAREYPYH